MMRMAAGLDVLRRRDFRLVFGAALVSLLGDGMVPVALSFAVLDLTGSATDLGLVLAARSVALVGSLLIGGVIADRVSRRTVMISADLVRLVAQGGDRVCCLVTGHAGVAELWSRRRSRRGQRLLQPGVQRSDPAGRRRLAAAGQLAAGDGDGRGQHRRPGDRRRAGGHHQPGVALLIDAGTYGASACSWPGSTATCAGARRPQRFVADCERDSRSSRPDVGMGDHRRDVGHQRGRCGVPGVGALTAKRQLGGAGAWALILAGQGVGR